MNHLLGALSIVALGAVACDVEPGDCTTIEDCACPCTDELEQCTGTDGRTYHNRCMLECNGQEVRSCVGSDGSEECGHCESEGTKEKCGSLDGNFQVYLNDCYRKCAGAKKEKANKC